jgi:hypothetical protein
MTQGYGTCRGCSEPLDFLVDGLCVACRRAEDELRDDRVDDLRLCSCKTEQKMAFNGKTLATHIVEINPACPQHGWEF